MKRRIASHPVGTIVFALSVLVFPLYCVQLNAAPAGAVYYVDGSTGNDSNAGTAGAPWRTIQKAANTMVAGETAIVNAGTYNERVVVTVSGTSGNLITFQAQGTVVNLGFNVQASYVKVNGFEIADLPYVHHTNRSTGSGVYVSGSNNQITNNYVHNTPAAAIYLNSSGTSNNLISGNRVVAGVECGIFVQGSNNLIVSNDISHTHSVEGSDADGIRFFGTGNIFRKNYVHDIIYSESPGEDPHIDALQTWGPVDTVTFEQNVFNIPDDSMQGSMISISINPVQNLTFRNNVFINGSRVPWGPAINIMGYSGSSLGSTVYNVTVVNNTFIRSGGNDLAYCVVLHDGVQNATVTNNSFYNCGGKDFPYWSTNSFFGGTATGITVRNNSVFTTDGVAPAGGSSPNDVWMQDPKFMNVGTRDFHLQTTSPLIDKGATLSQVTNDYDGVARPQGAASDIGAFEYANGSPPPAPPAPPAPASLANSTTMTRNSANFDPNNAVAHLWDGCLSGSASCTAGAMGIGSFWIEFDFGALKNLTSARLFGDADGSWWSNNWTLQYKSNAADPWSTAFSNVNAFFDNWSTQSLALTARYVRVEVFGNPSTGDTEARELEIYGTPAQPSNQPPTVNAGPDQTITLPASANLNGTASGGSTMTTTWSKVSGPGTVTFGNVNAQKTTASFSTAGVYVLRLTASDGSLSSSSDVTITVNAAPTGGAGYYVNGSTGNDGNAGTSTAPWKTIQKAANTLRPGETVNVGSGTYNERVVVTVSGTSGNLITFQAQGTVVNLGFNVQASYVKVNGFEIANLPYVHHTNRSTGSGVYVSGSNNQITNNYVHNTPAAAIYLNSSGTSNNLISGNRVVAGVECGIFVQGSNNLIASNDISHTHSVEGSDADGIRFFGTGNIFRKNYVHDIIYSESPGDDPHIDAIQTWGPVDTVTFEQNIFDIPDNEMQGSMISISTNPVQNLTFRNNIFINGSKTAWGPAINIMGYSGSSLGSTVVNVTVVNNTFIRTGGNNLAYCVVLHDGVQNATVTNNAFYNCGGRDFGYWSTNSFFGGTASNITVRNNSVFTTDGVAPSGGPSPNDVWMADPKFMNTATRNFHLQSTSPLINKGAMLSQVTNDYDGVARPQGAAYDIGAFEYPNSSPPPPPPPPTSPASLANSTTMTRNSANFNPNNPVEHLWDGCLTGSASCTAGEMGIGSFWIEFDFGALKNLTSARLFGDADGSWWSNSWTLQYKSNAADPWSTAFSNVNAFFDNWSTQSLAVTARYVRVEVFGNPSTRDTEARELEIYGTPAP